MLLFEQAHYDLQRYRENSVVWITDTYTGELIGSYKDISKPNEHFQNKTLWSVEHMSDFNVLLQGTENYQTAVSVEFSLMMAEMPVNRGKLLGLLIRHIKGKNTGVISKEYLKEQLGKHWSRDMKQLVGNCIVRIISNKLPSDSITYQLPPYDVFKGSDGMKALQISDWIDYSRKHNSELIKLLSESEREQYQKYTIEQII